MISSSEPASEPLAFCEHFTLLGAAASILPDHENENIIHCLVCGLSYHYKNEGGKLLVVQTTPYHPANQSSALDE